MKLSVIIAMAFTAVLFLAGCSDSNADVEVLKDKDDIHFVQLSSLTEQVRLEDDLVPGRIFTETIDGQEGIDLGELNAVEITKEGLYTAVLAPQSGKRAGCGRYWIALNGEPVPNTSVQICQSCPTLTSSATTSVTLPLVEGDILTFWQSGELGIQGMVPDELDEPAVPSVVITVFKL